MSKIVTTFVHPPIPDRRFDWCAHDDNYEPPDCDGAGGGPIGWGKTEAEAIADYREIIGYECRTCGKHNPRVCSMGGCPMGADL